MTGPDFAELAPAVAILRRGEWSGAFDLVTLSHADRFLRRKRLETVHGETFVLHLPPEAHVEHGDALALADGRLVEVVAAEEPLVEASGTGLVLAAWMLGSRHAAVQIESDRLLIPPDADLMQALAPLGVALRAVSEPFHPTGGGEPAHGHATHRPTVISRTGRAPPLQDDPLPEGGPFDADA